MVKKIRLLAAAFSMLFVCGCAAQNPPQKSLDFFAMDTYMQLKAYGENADAALEAAKDRITELETLLSVTDEQSDVWKINHAGGKAENVSEDTAAVLQEAVKVSEESDGALSVSVYPLLCAWGFTTGSFQIPDEKTRLSLMSRIDDSKIRIEGNTVTLPPEMQIDLGAVAKGYTGDCVLALLKNQGITSAIVSLGGNVQTLGGKPDSSDWTVGIRNPFSPEENLGVLQISDCAVITSGNYERRFTGEDGKEYWHILDPADGAPADNGLVSVTVVGKSGVRCDALSTALFVEGTERAAEHWRRKGDFEMILVTEQQEILLTEGIAESFTSSCEMPVTVLRRE